VNYLPDEIQQILRQMEKISVNEVAAKTGDIFIAVNVVDQKRRVLTIDRKLMESLASKEKQPTIARKILKG